MKIYKRLFESSEYVNVPYLTKLYKEFNKKYFNNDLGNYPIKTKVLKNVGAMVISMGVKKDPSSWKIKNLTFSTYILYTEEEVMGLLLHEMIHVKIIEEGRSEPNVQHGIFFKQELRDLQKKVNFEIPLEDDITNKKVDPKSVKKKEKIALILNLNNKSVAVYNIKLKNTIVDDFKRFPQSWLEKVKPIIVVSDNLELSKYPVKMKVDIKKYKAYSIEKNIVEDILKDGEILHKF